MADKGKKAYDNVIYDLFLWVFTVVVVGGPRIADVAHGAVAASIGAAATAAGGGALVVVFTVLAAVAFPAFIRYRVIASVS